MNDEFLDVLPGIFVTAVALLIISMGIIFIMFLSCQGMMLLTTWLGGS